MRDNLLHLVGAGGGWRHQAGRAGYRMLISLVKLLRYEVQSIGDVLDHLDHGLQHVIQAGIDRANQCARVTAHMICDWRIMPNQFTYEVCIYLPSVRHTT